MFVSIEFGCRFYFFDSRPSRLKTKAAITRAPSVPPARVQAFCQGFLPYRETARMALKPWLVEAALARLSQPLSPTDQRIVVKATRTPHRVSWPEWWYENP